MQLNPMRQYFKRVSDFFARNAEKREPWKTAIYAVGDMDVAACAWAEFIVPRGHIAGMRLTWHAAEKRALFWNVNTPLKFVGCTSFNHAVDIDGKRTGVVVCAHFRDEHGREYFVNKRFHEVFGKAATRYFLSVNKHFITYCTDEDEISLGSVCVYQPRKVDSCGIQYYVKGGGGR